MDRGIDPESKAWQKDNLTNEDTPISHIGREQAERTAELLLKEVDLSKSILISSPWLRCMQTALPFTRASKLKLCLDPAYGEGAEFCSHAAPGHAEEKDFKGLVNLNYKDILGGKSPTTEMVDVATALEKRFGFEEGRSIVIFSHADPCIFLAAALAKVKTDKINCASPCAMYTLQCFKEGQPYKVVRNGRIDHLGVYGQTKPWHHDVECVKLWRNFGWPPPEVRGDDDTEEGRKLKETLVKFLEGYHKLHF
mmetsp:Transcript_6836/g.9439  ORF Transcript_6836/g.9439 Transcript_6836/m.9439 type:complete len:252 (-) Transcript_6836:312-1067(-)|eukprot:CAMPEP_0184477968 /NCGR_PEP_ID=MMETSP0113_2-20130426/101_1 /TAXON_ID=91329 /ORGANISM="Norrisiella sphaerica, Strain BC52" /LENGTH=251 /DNA_ID=CAMNT_0026855591 /DNA_START=254 /DNA_END=1009 /DNA_ORIENTATION=-